MRVIGRFAESKDAVLFARFSEVGKCEFIKVNAPEDAWTSTDDGAGVLVKADALRKQAREVLVSAARYRTSSLPRSQPWVHGPRLLRPPLLLRVGSNHCRRNSPPRLLKPQPP
eukprot:scaffold27240_cov64-Phaeocystis_antarctica.AAC.1